MSEETPHRITLSSQLAAQHELLMAAVTKTAPRGSESVKLKQAQVGDLKGQWVCDDLTAIRTEDEDWPQFMGRVRAMLDDVDRELIRRNGTLIKRQLEETLNRGKGTQ